MKVGDLAEYNTETNHRFNFLPYKLSFAASDTLNLDKATFQSLYYLHEQKRNCKLKRGWKRREQRPEGNRNINTKQMVGHSLFLHHRIVHFFHFGCQAHAGKNEEQKRTKDFD